MRFKDLKELIALAKGRRNMKKAHTKKIEKEVANNMGTSHGLGDNSMLMSRGYEPPVMGTEEYKDLVKAAVTQDINYILVTGQNPDLPKIKKFCLT